MNNQRTPEERLWDYIDGLSSPEEKALLEKLMQSDPVWKQQYRELLDVHQLLHSSELEQPSLRFSKNVMEEISRLHIAPATRTYINKNIIRGIAIFFILMIAGFLIYGFSQLDWSAGDGSGIPVDLSKVDISRFFNNTYMNIFMMINLVLGLFLFDRYLASKRKGRHKEA